MDLDDAVPPPIRRSSREALQLQESLQLSSDDSDDEAVPPPITRRRSASLGSPGTTPKHQAPPPVPNKSPLRPHTEPRQGSSRSARNFSHPFKERFAQSNPSPAPHRRPIKPIPYRNNARIPHSLRRWSSLETIESVNEAPSIHEDIPHRPSIESDSTSFSTVEEESSYRSGRSVASQTRSEETHSIRSIVTPTPSATGSSSGSMARPIMLHKYSSGSSILRRLKPNKFSEPLMLPQHLEIEKTVSFDQTSQRSNSSSSTMTISSGRPSEGGYGSSAASNRSTNSQDWKSSEFDTSSLTASELKKCKKKGINPALYAEMKAARKGKWVSPIGGNTIL
ncbi:hypothetical protein K491DRAFT_358670 [Lophiostoma macrostomum CBS 122681]|uniref:Uncharacterized protein n=1 Tax=Lophiostoma macrostomum CBS 122681 TaxID=1314788 RepID=A0A6A6T9Z7_9PLEO|nr:hypothetical protein K491DRAFT_358670 [Lophiostoma macrostomum CBS 122681]